MILLEWDTANPGLRLAWVEARGVSCNPADAALDARVERGVAAALSRPPDDALRLAVRDCLRWGGYRPSGRGKPASEYLLAAAARGFPRINAVVDAANLLSLETGLPVSLLDLDRALEDASALAIREGREGEAYVFNAAGQVMDVKGLVGVARADGPLLANPVKDSMATKTRPETRNVGAALYAPRRAVGDAALASIARRLASWLEAHAGADAVEVAVLPEAEAEGPGAEAPM